MRVLNLITDPTVPPFTQQVESLAELGVEQTTVSVPGTRRTGDDGETTRSVVDYLRFYPPVLRASFGDYDVVHANYGLTAPAALCQLRLPVVVSLWGSDLMGQYGWLSQWCARFADATIVMSPEMDDALATDSHVIPHGVDLSLFEPMPKRQARETVGWAHDVTHVLFPYSTSRPVKDYPRAERVVGIVDDRLDRPVVLQSLDHVAHETVPTFMNAADAMILTSRREGSPNTVKEAMACNLPIVSTDVGDVRERLDGVHPSHVGTSDADLVDGLLDVLERDVRSNGRAVVEPLGLESMARRIRTVYESVV
ncbi:MAG: glycosyltransferase family 4 protein [Halanaeroarchaeum sp.]